MIKKIARRLRWIAYRLGIRAAWMIWDFLRLFSDQAVVERIVAFDVRGPLPRTPFGNKSAVQYARLLKVKHPSPWIEKRDGFPMAGRVPVKHGLAADGEATGRNFTTTQFFSGFPRLRDFWLGPGPMRDAGKVALSLRHPYEFNFYHAMVDVLGGLALAETAGLPHNAPIVIGPKLAQQPFFNAWKAMGTLADRTWVVQQEQIAASEVWVPQVWQPQRDLLLKIPPMLGVSPPDGEAHRKLFITRAVERGRALTNNREIEEALKRHGFEPVDLDRLEFRQQIALFQEAAVVVAIHGAGLTNLLFRFGAPTTVIEIFPPHDADVSFYVICKELGYKWIPLVGHAPTGKSRQANFALDVTDLERAIAAETVAAS